jgi:hypothetical protein
MPVNLSNSVTEHLCITHVVGALEIFTECYFCHDIFISTYSTLVPTVEYVRSIQYHIYRKQTVLIVTGTILSRGIIFSIIMCYLTERHDHELILQKRHFRLGQTY